MKPKWTMGAALLGVGILLVGGPALAARKLVAVLPGVVTYGSRDNGPVITDALRDRLGRLGFDVIQASRVESVLRSRQLGEASLSARDLYDLRSQLGVDYVVYPRVLSAGKSLGRNDYAATILVNVGGGSKSGFAHTRQVSQTFEPRVRVDNPAMDRAAADAAAEKLLQGFEKRAQ